MLDTVLLDQNEQELARIEGAIWPPRGAVVELGHPNRDAIVQDVRVLFTPKHATVVIRVTDLEDTTVPPQVAG
jgi:hypothetical protein